MPQFRHRVGGGLPQSPPAGSSGGLGPRTSGLRPGAIRAQTDRGIAVDGLLLELLTPLGPFVLLLLVAVAFAETGLLVGFLLPADTLLVTAGVLVAAGALQLPMWLSLVGVA